MKKQNAPCAFLLLPGGRLFHWSRSVKITWGVHQSPLLFPPTGYFLNTSARTLGVQCKNIVLTLLTSVRTDLHPMLLHWSRDPQCSYTTHRETSFHPIAKYFDSQTNQHIVQLCQREVLLMKNQFIPEIRLLLSSDLGKYMFWIFCTATDPMCWQ